MLSKPRFCPSSSASSLLRSSSIGTIRRLHSGTYVGALPRRDRETDVFCVDGRFGNNWISSSTTSGVQSLVLALSASLSGSDSAPP